MQWHPSGVKSFVEGYMMCNLFDTAAVYANFAQCHGYADAFVEVVNGLYAFFRGCRSKYVFAELCHDVLQLFCYYAFTENKSNRCLIIKVYHNSI